MKIKKISVLIIVVALTGCFSYGDRHEAFINTHSGDVGRGLVFTGRGMAGSWDRLRGIDCVGSSAFGARSRSP